MPDILDLLAPAKVNLCLHVLGRRADGYHDLRSLMAPVNLYDRLRLERLDANRIEVTAAGSPHVEGGEKNLCHRAASFYFRTTGATGGVRVRVDKKIPVGAGFAGGSSDAAAVLMGLEQIFGRALNPAERIRAAFDVGADVPFFFARCPAWVGGIGERVTPVPASGPLWLVLIHPGVFLSTAAVFSRHNKELTSRGEVHNITQFDFQGVAAGLHNDLEPAARGLEPAIGEAAGALRAAGLAAVAMTGSGSAVFGLCPDEALARRVADTVRRGVPRAWFVAAVHTLPRSPLAAEEEPWGVGKR